MKTLLLSLFVLIATVSANAQNLVVDSSFEDYDSCSSMFTNTRHLRHWSTPTSGTPDYFNYCNTGQVGVPLNFQGSQLPSDSNGYIGLYTYNNTYDYKEYIMCNFSGCESSMCQLTPGMFYEVSMDVSVAEIRSTVASDGLGAYFITNSSPNFFLTSVTLSLTPKIDYSSYGVITDTVNWVTLVDTFQADSAYTHMIIGGIVEYQNMNTIPYDNPAPQFQTSYYYIDRVKVEAIPQLVSIRSNKIPTITAGPNPFRDRTIFRLSNYSGSPYSLSLVNMMGRTVWSRAGVIGDEVVLERGSLPTGVYYYQFRMKGEQPIVGRVVIE